MGAPASGSRLIVAQRNLHGFRGLTLDGYGALLRGGPRQVPAALERLVGEQGRLEHESIQGVWESTLRGLFDSDPFIAFREVYRKAFEGLFERFGISSPVDECIDETFDEYRHAKAYPEVASVLRELESDVAMAVVSNMDTRLLLEALDRNGLSFTFVITSEEEQRYKPSASIFERALRYLGLPAENVLHVGDSYVEDFVGASSAGMGSILIRPRGGVDESRGTPGKLVHDLEEVRDILRTSWP